MKTSFHDSERRQKRDLLASLACMTARTYSGRRKDDRSSIILGSAIKDANYREKSAVERLPPRGTQLEGDRKMRETLSLVHEAITFDAHSPRVSTLNQHLEEIIRRIYFGAIFRAPKRKEPIRPRLRDVRSARLQR